MHNGDTAVHARGVTSAAPDPEAANSPAEFVRLLRLLKTWAGDPSYDELRRRTGIPRSTLAAALSHRRAGLPALEVVSRIAAACGLPPERVADWEQAWRRVRSADEPSPVTRAEWNGPRPLIVELVGRDTEQAALTELVQRRRLTTVVGPAGVGKTSLALHVAADAGLPAGVTVVVLTSAHDEDDILNAIATAVGVRGTGPEYLWAGLERRLAGRRMLLVLDNCEHVADDCARLLRRLLATCDQLVALVTSRRVLGIPEEIAWPLAPLALPDPDGSVQASTPAVALFLARAAEAAPHRLPGPEDLDAVGTICRRLDGLPLALELAAARLRTLPVRELAARLEVDLGVLRGHRPGVEGRHDTLEAALDWSYRLLPPDAQRLLARLSVFRGGFGLSAAEDVCGADPLTSDEIVPLLGTLVDHSLVQAYDSDQARYRLLEGVREFAAARLDEFDEREVVRDRHLDHVLELFLWGAGMPDFDDRLAHWRLVGDEIDNLRAALEHAFRTRPVDGVALAVAVPDFFVPWMAMSDMEHWVRQAGATAWAMPMPAPLRQLTALRQAQMLAMNADYVAAYHRFAPYKGELEAHHPREYAEGVASDMFWRTCALDPSAVADTPAVLAAAERAKGGDATVIRLSAAMVLGLWGRYDEAAAVLDLIEERFDEPDLREVSHTAYLRFAVAVGREDLPAAAHAQAEVLRIGLYQHGTMLHPERPICVLAAHAMVSGELAAATDLLVAAQLELVGRVPRHLARGQAIGVHLAEVLRRSGRLEEARSHLCDALVSAGTSTDHSARLTALLTAALLAHSLGAGTESRELAIHWEEIRRSCGLPAPIGFAGEVAATLGLDPGPSEIPPTGGDATLVPRSLLRRALTICETAGEASPVGAAHREVTGEYK